MYVRAGCFFGTLDEFVDRVKEVHAGTRYEREYLAAVELAKIVLEEEQIWWQSGTYVTTLMVHVTRDKEG